MTNWYTDYSNKPTIEINNLENYINLLKLNQNNKNEEFSLIP